MTYDQNLRCQTVSHIVTAAACAGVRALSSENESAILAWIRRHGRRTRARVSTYVRQLCWAAGWVLVAILDDALDDWIMP